MAFQKREPWYAKNSTDKKPYSQQGNNKQGTRHSAQRFEEDGTSTRPEVHKRGEQGRKQKFDEWSKGNSAQNAPNKKPYGSAEKKPYEPYAKKPYERNQPHGGRPHKSPAPPAPAPVPAVPVPPDENAPLLVYGRNPVKEAIKSGKSIDKVFVSEVGAGDGSLREIVRMAKDRSLVIVESTRKKLDEMTLPFGYGGKNANHQGIVAQLPECQYVEVNDILAAAKAKNEAPFVLVLDSIMDPHNLGSIIRSAECAGVHGIVIPKRRAASVTAAVAKASAGAVLYANIARVANLAQTLEMLKESGLWIAGAHTEGTAMSKANLAGPLALVIGAEGEGLSRLIKDKCDFLVSVPLKGSVDSLNASVAAGILLFEKNRQDAG